MNYGGTRSITSSGASSRGGESVVLAGLVAGLAVINVAGVCAHVGDRAASTSTIETQATLRIEVAAWRTTWIVGWANRHRHRDGGQTRQDRYPVGPIESQRKARAGLAGERNEAAGCGNQGGTPLRWRLKDGRPGPRPRGTWPSYVALDDPSSDRSSRQAAPGRRAERCRTALHDPADARPSNSCHIAPFAVSIEHNESDRDPWPSAPAASGRATSRRGLVGRPLLQRRAA
jgi:hypothetical protein